MSVEQKRKRDENRYRILQSLHREGSQQRADLATTLGIRKSSVTSIVSELLNLGMVVADQPERTRSPISIDTSKYSVIAGNILQGSVQLARVFLDGKVSDLQSREYNSNTSPASVLNLATELIQEKLNHSTGDVLGIGLSVPGILDTQKGIAIRVSNLNQWENIPVVDHIASRVQQPIKIGHDARCELLGNTYFSKVLNTVKNVLYVSIHNGIGCSATVDGKLLYGRHFAAGEIACLNAGSEGRPCVCGKKDCLQTYCGIPAIIKAVDKTKPNHSIIDAESLAQAASEDNSIEELIYLSLIPLTEKIASLTALIDPDAIVLGTDNKALAELMIPRFAQHFRKELFGLYAHDTPVHAGLDRNLASIRGIAAKAIESAFSRGIFRLSNYASNQAV
jgi:predicted NBD/HSP70 family sugar kinase